MFHVTNMNTRAKSVEGSLAHLFFHSSFPRSTPKTIVSCINRNITGDEISFDSTPCISNIFVVASMFCLENKFTLSNFMLEKCLLQKCEFHGNYIVTWHDSKLNTIAYIIKYFFYTAQLNSTQNTFFQEYCFRVPCLLQILLIILMSLLIIWSVLFAECFAVV